jgi:futalosine hydrolase
MRPAPLIGIISAVAFEADLLVASMGAPGHGPGIAAGTLGPYRTVYIESGIGLVNASHAATVLAERHRPDALILIGIGGAYPGSGLGIADIAIAESETYADAGILMADGLHPLSETGFPLLVAGGAAYFETLPVATSAVGIDLLARLPGAKKGAFLSVTQITGTADRAKALAERHGGAIIENMEGAAVAHVALMYGVPFMELRGVSNRVEDRDLGGWDRPGAARACQEALLRALDA